VGAAGAGAQAAAVFGDVYLGTASAILTLLILVFSEIIPKTLGAYYWKDLAPITAYGLRILIWVLYPFVKLSEKLTGLLAKGSAPNSFNRIELGAMTDISAEAGYLNQQESRIIKNVLALREAKVKDVMTPRTVVFTVPEKITVGEFFERFENKCHSRIPIYGDEAEHVSGFVLRNELLLARANGETEKTLKNYLRELPAVPDSMSLSRSFDQLLQQRAHILLVVNEYGDVQGILTLEDVLETLLGLEIVDESDQAVDMQELARRLWQRRAQRLGLDQSE
jgi:CBS domain containing-hemolysin-like protein